MLPSFEAMFSNFNEDLPRLTRWVLQSYRYWWILPALTTALIAWFILRPPQTLTIRTAIVVCGCVVPVVCAVALFLVSFVSMYLPVFVIES